MSGLASFDARDEATPDAVDFAALGVWRRGNDIERTSKMLATVLAAKFGENEGALLGRVSGGHDAPKKSPTLVRCSLWTRLIWQRTVGRGDLVTQTSALLPKSVENTTVGADAEVHVEPTSVRLVASWLEDVAHQNILRCVLKNRWLNLAPANAEASHEDRQ